MTPAGRGHLEGVEITKRYAGLVANDEVEIEVARRSTDERLAVKVILAAWDMETAVRNGKPR